MTQMFQIKSYGSGKKPTPVKPQWFNQ